jgi:hypothetical protein
MGALANARAMVALIKLTLVLMALAAIAITGALFGPPLPVTALRAHLWPLDSTADARLAIHPYVRTETGKGP